MSHKTAQLLSRPINYAVVQLPERHYPGVVMQGDSLNTAILSLQSVRRELRDEEVRAELDMVLDQLVGARDHYEYVCRTKGIELPYSARA